MDELSRPPLTLLHRLAHDDFDEDDIEIFMAMLQAEGLADVPPWVQARASRIMSPSVPEMPQMNGLQKTAIRLAQLIFDSWNTPRLVASRSAEMPVRQVLLQADTIDISLHIQTTAAQRVAIIGQLLGHDNSSAHVRLYRGDLQEASVNADAVATCLPESLPGLCEVDSFGEFAFQNVVPGRYVLSIQTEVVRIDSVPLDLVPLSDH